MSNLDCTLPERLAQHMARLLVGTNVTPQTAPDVAAGRLPVSGAVAAALRDGWTSSSDETARQPR